MFDDCNLARRTNALPTCARGSLEFMLKAVSNSLSAPSSLNPYARAKPSPVWAATSFLFLPIALRKAAAESSYFPPNSWRSPAASSAETLPRKRRSRKAESICLGCRVPLLAAFVFVLDLAVAGLMGRNTAILKAMVIPYLMAYKRWVGKMFISRFSGRHRIIAMAVESKPIYFSVLALNPSFINHLKLGTNRRKHP